MARRNDSAGKRSLSHASKPYDANNSFVKKVATKVTDLIPQRSWISKWFNASQDNGDTPDDIGSLEETELDDESRQSPPLKRPRIRTDVTHPPGTFSIRPRTKAILDDVNASKERYSGHEGMEEDFESTSNVPSGTNFVSSTPAIRTDGIHSYVPVGTGTRTELNSAIVASSNGTANGTDDNSESSESTSGCSSLIQRTNRQDAPSNMTYDLPFSLGKKFSEDKSFANRGRSQKSLFLDNSTRDSLSSRRPSFDASIVTNALDRASPLASPFYTGNITYGGANAAGLHRPNRSLFNNSSEPQLKVPQRASVQVKPSNTTSVDSSGMSQTAKKILEALEHFSSPISDAKRIPLKGTDSSGSPSTSRKRGREEESSRIGLRHLTRELTVPSVPDILKIRRRQKLQDTTVAARQIVSAHSEPVTLPQEYRLRTKDNESTKYHGKVKGKSKTNLDEEETVETINLPDIPLPISSLPNFNFMMPQRNVDTSPKSATTTTKTSTYKFASPIKLTEVKSDVKSMTEFTFSKPISAEETLRTSKSSMPAMTSLPSVPSLPSMPNFIWSATSTAPRPKEKSTEKKEITESKTSSIINIFTAKKNDSPSSLSKAESTLQTRDEITFEKSVKRKSDITDGKMEANTKSITWECSECLLKNNDNETRCIGCKAARSSEIKPPKTNEESRSSSKSETVDQSKSTESKDCFGSHFQFASDDRWECDSCRARNKQTDVKCVSCTKPRSFSYPGALSTDKKTSSSIESKPKEPSWECPGCMLINKATVITCPCCNASKPSSRLPPRPEDTNASSIQDKSKTPDKDKSKDPSTNSMKISTPVEKTDSTLQSTKKDSTVQPLLVGFGDEFKKPAGAWTCDSCMLQNNATATECVACSAAKPGTSQKSGAASSGLACTFKFGVDKASEDNTKSTEIPSTNGFEFGVPKKSEDATKFSFGLPKAEKDEASLKEKKPTSGFTFGTTSKDTQIGNGTSPFAFGAKPKVEVKEITTPSNTSVESKTIASTSSNVAESNKPIFTFGAPASIITTSSTSLPSSSSSQPSFVFSGSKTGLAGTEPSTVIPTFGQTPAAPIQPPTTSTPAPSASAFSFGATKPFESQPPAKKLAASTFSSSTSETPSFFGQAGSKPTLTFGQTEAKTTAPSSTLPAPPVFGGNAATKPQVPAFGLTSEADKSSTISFGNAEKKPCTFGQPGQPQEVPTFGQPSAPTPTPVFGTPSTAPSIFSSTSTTPLFGNNESSNTASTNTFATPSASGIFSTTKTSETATPNPNLFTFGSTSSIQNSHQTGSGFNFSSNVIPSRTATDKPLLPFGNNSNNTSTVFGSTFNTPSSGFGFVAPKTENAFGQSQSTAPIFGQTNQTQPSAPSFSSAPASNGGFNFGSTPAASSSAFSFGGTAPTPAPSSGFNFNPPTTTPTVSFDPNTPPSFNFTGGSAPTTFSATPQPQRKIKKAVRRIR